MTYRFDQIFNRQHLPKKKTIKVVFWSIVLILVWASVPALAKLGTSNLNGIEMVFWINLFALPVVTLWVLPKEHRSNFSGYFRSKRTLLLLLGIGLLGNLLFQIFYFSSYQTITAVAGSVLIRFGNILFVVASVLFLKERHSRAWIVAIVLATIGALLSTAKPGATLEFSFSVGFWLMIVATMFRTAYNFANNGIKDRLPDERANLLFFKVSTTVAIVLWAIVTTIGPFQIGPAYRIDLMPNLADLRVPFLIGALADGVGFLAFLKLLSLTNSLKTVIVTSLVAIGQVFIAVIIFNESATFVNTLLAPALVIVPIMIANIIDIRAKS